MHNLKRFWIVVLALCVGLFVAAGSLQAEDVEDEGPSGRVWFEAKDVGLIISGQKGKGVLEFQGERYPFKLKGVNVGSIGKVEMIAEGNVYGLDDIKQFEGVYLQGKAALALKSGKSGTLLINRHGVMMSIFSDDEGAALSLGRGGVKIKLIDG